MDDVLEGFWILQTTRASFPDWSVIFNMREPKGAMKFWGEMDTELLSSRMVRLLSFRAGSMVGLTHRNAAAGTVAKGLPFELLGSMHSGHC